MHDFGAGLTLGLAVAIILAMTMSNCTGLTPAEIEPCGAVCKPNGGMAKLYMDGDCLCENGATFEDLEVE